jgi:hypothetical protein
MYTNDNVLVDQGLALEVKDQTWIAVHCCVQLQLDVRVWTPTILPFFGELRPPNYVFLYSCNFVYIRVISWYCASIPKSKSQKIKVSADQISADQISKCANPSYTHKSSLIKLSIMPSD